jgi:site-specific recombinase XerD
MSGLTARIHTVAPLEALAVPASLAGAGGTNRVHGKQSQIAADNDIAAVMAWLARFADSPATFQNYRKEAERLVLWSTIQLQKPLSSLSHEDLLAYQRFLADPQPAARWVITGARKPPRGDPGWRPFAGPLASSSQRQAVVILNTMFSWLVHAGYLAGNPLSLSRQRARKAKPRVTRYLPPELIDAVKDSVLAMPRELARDKEHYERNRWLLSLLFLCGLRVNEVAANTMGGFFDRLDNTGARRWWLEVTGKGDKTRIVPATDELMAELALYRRSRGLPPLPTPEEKTPLVLPIGGKSRHLGRAALHAIVKGIFQEAAARLRKQDAGQEARAALLEKASTHWLRHSAGSAMADGALDLRFVRDNLGHESLSTTSTYLHSQDDERHRQTEKAHRLSWGS